MPHHSQRSAFLLSIPHHLQYMKDLRLGASDASARGSSTGYFFVTRKLLMTRSKLGFSVSHEASGHWQTIV
ncbi:hypothetical protein GW813_14790 [bacterium]|nr:hypothetical protein [bacterium]